MNKLCPPSFQKKGIIAGNFDVIHPGYVRFFNDAKANACDWLIVALHVDPTIERPSKALPVLSADERSEILLSLSAVDQIMCYNTEKELNNLLASVPDHVRVIGSDYKDSDFTGKGLAGHIYYHDRNHDWSTTRFKTEIALQCVRQGYITGKEV